ncbi:hypothetical protein ACJX0J_005237 [Zea mays]
MPIGVPKDTFFSIEDGNSDIFFAYYRARTPEFLLEWVDFFSQYLLMKERAPVGAHLRLNRVITQQVRRAFKELILKSIQIGLLYFIYDSENMSIFLCLGPIIFFLFVWITKGLLRLRKYSIYFLTLSVLWKNRTHDAPISLFHYEWYACDNNDKIFLILIFLTKNVISKDFVRNN